MKTSYNELAKMIDHSLLHPTMTDDDLIRGCILAKKYNTASVCIKPYAVPLAKELLMGSDVKVGTVIGFPHGNSSVEIKIAEALKACKEGASEIDMVVNIGKVLGNNYDFVKNEISLINKEVIKHNAILKVIFENDYLQNSHIIRLCEICSEINVAFVKTSTGYGFVKQPNGMYSYAGATIEHLKLMRLHTKPSIEVKAAGGVRTLKDLVTVKSIGVTRVGATATAEILNEASELISRGIDPSTLADSNANLAGGY